MEEKHYLNCMKRLIESSLLRRHHWGRFWGSLVLGFLFKRGGRGGMRREGGEAVMPAEI